MILSRLRRFFREIVMMMLFWVMFFLSILRISMELCLWTHFPRPCMAPVQFTADGGCASSHCSTEPSVSSSSGSSWTTSYSFTFLSTTLSTNSFFSSTNVSWLPARAKWTARIDVQLKKSNRSEQSKSGGFSSIVSFGFSSMLLWPLHEKLVSELLGYRNGCGALGLLSGGFQYKIVVKRFSVRNIRDWAIQGSISGWVHQAY